MKNSIYKSDQSRKDLLALYEQKLAYSGISTYEDRYLETPAGKTHVIIAGKPQNPPIVILHGINAGAPLAMEPLADLVQHYCLYGIDTLGQVGKSDEVRLPLKGTAIGQWLTHCLNQLQLTQPTVIGISYGGFLLQRLLAESPQRVGRGIFVVPAGFGEGPFWSTFRRVSWPLLRFLLSKSESNLKRFLSAFSVSEDSWSLAFHRSILLGVKVDYRRPPMATAAEMAAVEAPIHLIAADDDVFFPAEQSVEKCRRFYKNFQGYHILTQSKHIPARAQYPEIAGLIEKWLNT